MPKPTPIDPFDPQYWDKPLFVVYGSSAFPSLLCCKVRLNDGVPTIWGFSIWRRTPGFRTLGIKLKTWVEQETDPRFYLTQEEAFEAIRETFSKAAPAPKVRKGHPLILTDEEWETLRHQVPAFEQQVVAQRVFARDKNPVYADKHRKAAREYRNLIKAIKEQDPHG